MCIFKKILLRFWNFFFNFEKWTQRTLFWICFCNKITYHTQQFPGWLNSQLHGYNLNIFQKYYFQKRKKKLKKFTCILKNK